MNTQSNLRTSSRCVPVLPSAPGGTGLSHTRGSADEGLAGSPVTEIKQDRAGDAGAAATIFRRETGGNCLAPALCLLPEKILKVWTVAEMTIAARSDRRAALSASERGSILCLALLTACGIATAFGFMPWGLL